MNFKKLILTASLSIGFTSPSFSQGIPVIDSSAIAKSGLEHAEQLAQWASQIQEMQRQYAQMEREFESLTGSRDMSQLLNNATRLITGDTFTRNYQDLISLGEGGASTEAKTIYDSIKVLGCSHVKGATDRAMCEAQAYAVPEVAAYVEASLKGAKERAEQLQDLIFQVDQAGDMKAAADLANRIASEQALLQNEQTMVELALAQRQAQTDLIFQKKKEANLEKILTNTYNPFAPK